MHEEKNRFTENLTLTSKFFYWKSSDVSNLGGLPRSGRLPVSAVVYEPVYLITLTKLKAPRELRLWVSGVSVPSDQCGYMATGGAHSVGLFNCEQMLPFVCEQGNYRGFLVVEWVMRITASRKAAEVIGRVTLLRSKALISEVLISLVVEWAARWIMSEGFLWVVTAGSPT